MSDGVSGGKAVPLNDSFNCLLRSKDLRKVVRSLSLEEFSKLETLCHSR